MAKMGEIDYLKNLGHDGVQHALNKPYSDVGCGAYLNDIGSIISLLPAPPARLLDLGAGSGWTSCFFAQRGYDVVAQDIAPDMVALLEINRDRYKLSNLKSIVCDYEGLQYQEEFDCAVFYDCLHHAEDEKAALSAAFRALKPGGILITAEPGKGHSQGPASRLAIEQYGVNEKDMPPRKIISLGYEVGFRDSKIFRRARMPAALSDFKPGLKSTWLVVGNLLFLAWMQLVGRHLDQSHFVVLKK